MKRHDYQKLYTFECPYCADIPDCVMHELPPADSGRRASFLGMVSEQTQQVYLNRMAFCRRKILEKDAIGNT